VTDRQTDGQNYDSQDRATIAVSRGNKFSAAAEMEDRARAKWAEK